MHNVVTSWPSNKKAKHIAVLGCIPTYFLVVDGAKMFTPLVVLIMIAVLCSSAMTGEIPYVSFYLRGTEEKDLMQDVSACSYAVQLVAFCDYCR